MKTTLLVLGLLSLARTAPAQAPGLNLYPNASIAQCPNVGVTYTIVPWVPACHQLDTVIGGSVVNQVFQNDQLKVTIVWQAPVDSMPGHLAVLRADSACAYAHPGQGWDVTIIPTLATKPVISGESAYFDMGRYNFTTLRASLDLGVPGLTPTLFEWQAPAGGWIFSTYGSLDHASTSLRISPTDTLEQGCVRVRGKYPCGAWSDWTEYCLQGTIPKACPIQLDRILLCGDTTEHVVSAPVVNLPALPQYIWSPIRYVWTTPPGWKVLSANPNPQSSARVQPDGHTSGLISLVVTTSAFTSAPCEYTATYLPAHPTTVVTGPDLVCTDGDFGLDPLPPPQSDITWQVTPVDPATPQVASPDHGSGMASFQISDPAVSGDFRITYTITNACGSISRSRDFFVGKPRFFDTTLDGAPYVGQPLCVGFHGASTGVNGRTEPNTTWTASPDITGFAQRDSFVFSLAATGEGDCPLLTASAANTCGTTDLPLSFCLQPDCSLPQFELQVYPNPAYIIVILETKSADQVVENYGLIEQVEVFNHLGQLVTTWHEPPGHRIVKAIGNLPHGMYALRVTVWDQIIIKPLLIAR